MESWRKVWRDGVVPLLSTESLEALRGGLVNDDPRLIQGATTTPPPLQCVQESGVQIGLTYGKVAVVDESDYLSLSGYQWHAFDNQGKGWYARTKKYGSHIFMHQMLMNATGVDHRDGDGLNNRRDNLRLASAVDNARNRKSPKNGSSKYKGVYLFRPETWRATITYEGKQHSLGLFDSEEKAARAYDRAARAQFGEFAFLNFPGALCEAACGLGYCGWQGDGLETVAEVEEFFAKMCFEIDRNLGEPAGCRWFLNWFDETPRDEMRRDLLTEVELTLNERRESGNGDRDGRAGGTGDRHGAPGGRPPHAPAQAT